MEAIEQPNYAHWRLRKATERKAVWFGPDINVQVMDGELAEKMAAEHNAVVDAWHKAEEQLSIVMKDRDFYKATLSAVRAALEGES